MTHRVIQLYRGTTAQNDAFTGAEGELTMDTQTKGLRVHDGTTQGGIEVPTAQTADYVVEFQTPTAENNYTWYRKYKSGWVEQGGYVVHTTTDDDFKIVLAVEMEWTLYTITTTLRNYNNSGAGFVNVDNYSGITPRWFHCRIVNKYNTPCSPLGVFWTVSGMAAQ